MSGSRHTRMKIRAKVQVYVSMPLADRLDKDARKRDMPISAVIRGILEEHYKIPEKDRDVRNWTYQ